MFRRRLLVVVLSACIAACDPSEPRNEAPSPSPVAPRPREDAAQRLPIRVEITVNDADSAKRISAEIDSAFESHRDAKRVGDGGEWQIGVVGSVTHAVVSTGHNVDINTVKLAYEISALPPTVSDRVDGHGRHFSSSSRGRIMCDMTELASKFSDLITKIERLARLEPSPMPSDGETDLINVDDVRDGER